MESTRKLVSDAGALGFDLTAVPLNGDEYDAKSEFIDFGKADGYIKCNHFDASRIEIGIPHKIMNAVAQRMNAIGKYQMNPIRTITEENVQPFKNSNDIQFCQLSVGLYVLIQLENREVTVYDIETGKKR